MLPTADAATTMSCTAPPEPSPPSALTAYPSGTPVQLHLDPDHCLAYPQEPTKTLLVEDAAPAIPRREALAPPSFAKGYASSEVVGTGSER